MFWFNWFKPTAAAPLSARKALKKLLKGKYHSAEEYDRYLALVEEQTGHPDIETLLSQGRQQGLKSRQLLAQAEADVALLDALVGHNKGRP